MKTLERRLGLSSVVAISVAAMLGSGLFVLPGIAFAQTGPSVWLAYVAAGLCVLPATLSKAELATAMPVSGGTYVYIDRAFGPLIGTVMGLGLWVSLLLKSAFALVGFGAYLEIMSDVPIMPVSLGLLGLIIALNIVGVRKVGKAQAVVVIVTVTGLLLLSARGLWQAETGGLRLQLSHGAAGFWGTVSLVYISYAGVTKVAAVAEEVVNPRRNLPIGMLTSLLFATALYGAVTYALVANVPAAELAGNVQPVYALAMIAGGPWVGTVAAVIGVVTMTSMANSGLLAASRFPFAMSRNEQVPGFLKYVSARFITPIPSILLTGVAMAAAIVMLDLEHIAKLASALMILGFMLVNLAVIILRESQVTWYKPAFRSPLYPLVQGLGVLISLGLLMSLGWTSVLAVATSVALGLPLFLIYGRRNTERRGVLGRMGPRQELLASNDTVSTEADLPERAAVVVPLLGHAHGAETLAEIASGLAAGEKVAVVHITDLPEQTWLDAELAEDPIVRSMRRRVRSLAEQDGHDIEFDAVATHDHVRLAHDLSRRVNCQWLLMEWRGTTERRLLPFNPLGWLVNHLSCNFALFKDVGTRSVRRILVYAEPGPHDALVMMTADQLAAVYYAEITLVRHVPSGAPADALSAEQAYLTQLQGLCTSRTHTRILRGEREVQAVSALTAEFDLLVMGAPPESGLWRQLRGNDHDLIMERSACSVLRLTAARRLADRVRHHPDEAPSAGHLDLDDYLVPGCARALLPSMGKQALFTLAAEMFARAMPELGAETIETALWDRERQQNTAMERGLAVPHATLPGLTRSYVGVLTLQSPMDYKAPDGHGVDIVFVTLGPPSERNTHLRILATLSQLVIETPFLERLRMADNQTELLSVLLASHLPTRGAGGHGGPGAQTAQAAHGASGGWDGRDRRAGAGAGETDAASDGDASDVDAPVEP